MPSRDAVERTLIARQAAHTRWADVPDRAAAMATATAAALSRFEKQARERHPDADDATIAKLAASARSAFYAGLARKSAAARRARRQARELLDQADTMEAELAEQIGAEGGAL